MVVEPERARRDQLVKTLRQDGHAVVATDSAHGMLRLLRQVHARALVLNLALPDMRGDVAAELALATNSHLATAILFFVTTPGHEALTAPPVEGQPVLQMPVDLEVIRRIVRGWLRTAHESCRDQ